MVSVWFDFFPTELLVLYHQCEHEDYCPDENAEDGPQDHRVHWLLDLGIGAFY